MLNVLLEGVLLVYVGPCLLGFKPCWKKTVLGGVVVGVTGFLLRSLCDSGYLPLGTHTLGGVLGLAVVLCFLLPAPLGIASIAALMSFTLFMFTGTLALMSFFFLSGWDLREVLANPVWRFVLGLLEDFPLGVVAFLCYTGKIQLFRIEKSEVSTGGVN